MKSGEVGYGDCRHKCDDEEYPTMKAFSVEELFLARVPRSSAEVRRVFIHDIEEDEGVGQQEQQGDKREMMRKEMK